MRVYSFASKGGRTDERTDRQTLSAYKTFFAYAEERITPER
jgi:hypothetical protein